MRTNRSSLGPSAVWGMFLEVLGLTAKEAAQLWRHLEFSERPKVRALLLSFRRLDDQLGAHEFPEKVTDRMFADIAPPVKFASRQ